MRLETRIKKRDNKLIIELSKSVIKRGELKEGDILEINLQETNMTISNKPRENPSLNKIIIEDNEDIYSKTLREEELFLAK